MGWMVAVAVAIAATAAVLFAPLRLRAGADGDGRARWFAELVALGGLARLGRDGGGYYWACWRWRRALTPPAKRADATAPAERGRALARRWDGLTGGERQALLRMLKRFWTTMDVAVEGNIRYGFADPAATAWAHAMYCAARGTGRLPGFCAEADFADAGWSGEAAAVLTLRPAYVALAVARFFGELCCRRIIDRLRGGRRNWQVQA
ncbi:hypothetical protein [Anaeroselena agilis]|uniref:DUF2953 domain-containing protein n=1 Tax=Anaeroselena agilis TaxID=3063788 RepID=A0ABU3P3P2_9FIRM|nr:hypothetical protein [Selenomonadales bacterium 4137-cl]